MEDGGRKFRMLGTPYNSNKYAWFVAERLPTQPFFTTHNAAPWGSGILHRRLLFRPPTSIVLLSPHVSWKTLVFSCHRWLRYTAVEPPRVISIRLLPRTAAA